LTITKQQLYNIYMILKKIAHILEITDTELGKAIGVKQSQLSILNRMAKNPCPAIILFKIKELYGDKICLNKIFTDEKLYKSLLERNIKK
jgi:hypothetical protein